MEALVETGASQRQIAQSLGVSQATVKHWLGRFNLRTKTAILNEEGRERLRQGGGRVCQRHPDDDFTLTGGRYRCRKCLVDAIRRDRHRLKRDLVAHGGGKCIHCGYDKTIHALQFDHREPTLKQYDMARLVEGRKRTLAFEEVKKCDLVCANCHQEIEAERREAKRASEPGRVAQR